MDGRRWLFTKEQLANTPSRKCGISDDLELSYRQQAANFIQEMGQRLNVNQLCINTAIVYLHRFYMYHSFEKFVLHAMSAAALFLSAKVEEQPRKLEHIIKVYHLLRTKERTLDVTSDVYLELAQELVINENILLQTLGFNVQVDHPHSHVVKTCQLVRASKELAQTSYYLATNSLHSTTLCLQYNPKVVAALCIHLACKWSNWELSPSIDGKDWWQYIDSTITADQLEELTREFLNVLEKMDPQLRQKMLSLRGSGAAAAGSPAGSRGPSPAPARTAGGCTQQRGSGEVSTTVEGHQKQASHVSYGESDIAGWADDFAGDFGRTESRFAAGESLAESGRTSSSSSLREQKERARAAGGGAAAAPSGAALSVASGTAAAAPAASTSLSGGRAGDARHPADGSGHGHAHGSHADGSRPRGGDSSGRPKLEGSGSDRHKGAPPGQQQQQPSSGSGSKQQPKAHKNHDGSSSSAAADGQHKRPPPPSHAAGSSADPADRYVSHADVTVSKVRPPFGGAVAQPAADAAAKDGLPQPHAVAAKPDGSRQQAKSGSHHSVATAAPVPHRHGGGSHQPPSSHHGGHRPPAVAASSVAAPSSSSGLRGHQAHHSAERHGSVGHAPSSSAEKHPSSHQQQHRPVLSTHQQQSLTNDRRAGDSGRSAAAAISDGSTESGHRAGNGTAVAATAASSEVSVRGHGAGGTPHEGHHRPHSGSTTHAAGESAAPAIGFQRSAAASHAQGSSAEVVMKRVRSSDSASLSSPAKKQRSAELQLLQQPQLAASSFLLPSGSAAASTAQPSMPTLSTETIGVGDQVDSPFSVSSFLMPAGLSREGPRFGENGAAALQVSSNGLGVAAAAFASLASARTGSGPQGSAAGAVPAISPASYTGRGGLSLVASASALQAPPSPHI